LQAAFDRALFHSGARYLDSMYKAVNSVLARYGVAVTCVVLALLARWLLGSQFGDRAPYLTYFLGVIVAAYVGGLGPGLLATFLSVVVIGFFWLQPVQSLVGPNSQDWAGVFRFLLVGITICVFSGALHSARRRAEDNARSVIEQESRYRNIVETASEGIWIIDGQARTTFVNARLAEMFGYTQEEMLGSEPYDFIFEEDQQAARGRFHSRMSGEKRPLDFRYRRKDGSELLATVSTSILSGSKGEFVGLLALVTDNTERKRAEAERAELLEREQRSRELAETASRMKDEFLATLSHELRTPLNAIIGWTAMLTRGQVEPSIVSQAIEVIHRNARAQAKLVEDMLDVSRIISGKFHLDVRHVELVPIVDATIDVVRPMAEAKHINIEKEFDSLTGEVSGDSTRLQQIMWNLLSNAIKFTPEGGQVKVRVGQVNSQAEITVTDTGQGISAEFLPYVFERFRQADSSYTRRHSGLGLGLAIVRHLVELHGGTVSAYSIGKGQGSTFTVRIPPAVVSTGTKSAGGTFQSGESFATESRLSPIKGLRVLIIDDDRDTREMVAAVLAMSEAEVKATSSAAEALETLRTWRPDALVSDIGMPEEDGYSLIRKVRRLRPEEGGTTPAIALTGYAGSEEGERALAAGFQVHLPKPAEPSSLVNTIANLCGLSGKVRGA
jgi:PAS domain S-box-containing protein